MPTTFIITGKQGGGKTTKLKNVVKKLKQEGFLIRGFIADGHWLGDQRSGFDIVDLVSGDCKELCGSEFKEEYFRVGRFYFNPEALRFGENILSVNNDQKVDLLVIDEVGLFELQGKIWAAAFSRLSADFKNNLLITARIDYVDEIITKFKLNEVVVFHPNDPDGMIVRQIRKVITYNNPVSNNPG